MGLADLLRPVKTGLRTKPVIRNGRDRVLEHVQRDLAGEFRIGLIDLRPASKQRMIGNLVGPGDHRVRATPSVLVDQGRAVIDEVELATPEEHVRVTPRSVRIADERAEPHDFATPPTAADPPPRVNSHAPSHQLTPPTTP